MFVASLGPYFSARQNGAVAGEARLEFDFSYLFRYFRFRSRSRLLIACFSSHFYILSIGSTRGVVVFGCAGFIPT